MGRITLTNSPLKEFPNPSNSFIKYCKCNFHQRAPANFNDTPPSSMDSFKLVQRFYRACKNDGKNIRPVPPLNPFTINPSSFRGWQVENDTKPIEKLSFNDSST